MMWIIFNKKSLMFNSNPPSSKIKSDQQVAAQVHNPFGMSDQQVVKSGLVPNQQGIFGVPQQNVIPQQQVQGNLFGPPPPPAGYYPPFGASNAMTAMMSNSMSAPHPYASNAVGAMMSNSNFGPGPAGYALGSMYPFPGAPMMPAHYGGINPAAFGSDPYPQTHNIFADDEPLGMEKAKWGGSKPPQISIELKSLLSNIPISNIHTAIPAMCSIKTQGGSRSNSDIICVIDTSGSMSGHKINLVVETLLYLLTVLTEDDRVCLIGFNNQADKKTPLARVSEANRPKLIQAIKRLPMDSGGTSIGAGLSKALQVLANRKQANTVSSILLLSDGLDGSALKQCTSLVQNSKDVYTIHSFGFGTDHDSDMMSSIAKLKDGNFYFVDNISSIDEAFVNALGAILSVAAEKITIEVQGYISRTFGQKSKLNGNKFKVQLYHLITGISKDYVFMLNLSKLTAPGSYVAATAAYEAITPQKLQLKKNAQLQVTVSPADSNTSNQEDLSVLNEYMRVLAGECLIESKALADKREFKQAKQQLENMIKMIEGNTKVDKEKLKPVVKSLKDAMESCNEVKYEQVGRGIFNNVGYQVMSQQTNMFSNTCQMAMGQNLQMNKMNR